MSISDLDMKLLWGRAAGRCSMCNRDLTVYLESNSDVIIGEMAHIIARKGNGPRGSEKTPQELRNTYDNLILLCPTHHTLIDKAPQDFSVEQILSHKEEHESRIKQQLTGRKFSTGGELFGYVQRLLIENKIIYEQFGPASETAKRNPISEIAHIWQLRKVVQIIPNNNQIIAGFEANQDLLTVKQYEIFIKFREHAIAFERNSYDRLDREGVSTFPKEFREMIELGE